MNFLGQVHQVKWFSGQEVENPQRRQTWCKPGWVWKPGPKQNLILFFFSKNQICHYARSPCERTACWGQHMSKKRGVNILLDLWTPCSYQNSLCDSIKPISTMRIWPLIHYLHYKGLLLTLSHVFALKMVTADKHLFQYVVRKQNMELSCKNSTNLTISTIKYRITTTRVDALYIQIIN